MPNDGNNGKGLTLQNVAELLARLSDDVVRFSAAVSNELYSLREQQDAQNTQIEKLEQKIAEREAVEAGEHD